MVLNNIKTRQQERGFTIVELLIVIVVIAILATITIVAYNGVQARAKQATAADNASKVQQVAESINSDTGSYPRLLADWTAAANVTAKLPVAIGIVNTAGTGGSPTALSAANATTAVSYEYCGATATPGVGLALGARIRYWDSVTGAAATTYLYVGSGVVTPAAATNCVAYVVPAS